MLVTIVILILTLPIFANKVTPPISTNSLGNITNPIGVSTNKLVLSTNIVDISKYECKVCNTLTVCDRLRDMRRLAEMDNDTNAVEFIASKERLILGKQEDMPEGVIIAKPPVVEFKVVSPPTADITLADIYVMSSPTADILAVRPLTADILAVRPLTADILAVRPLTADILAVRPLTADILAVRPTSLYYAVTTHDIDSWKKWYNITEFKYDDGAYGRVDKGTLLYDYLPSSRHELTGDSIDTYLNLRDIIIERRRVHSE